MGIIELIRLFRKWVWLFLLGGILAGGSAYLWSNHQGVKYEASATIAVGHFMQAPNPDASDIRAGAELAKTYAELAKTYEVIGAAVEAGRFSISAEDLKELVSARVVTDTSLLVISVTYSDPLLAADMANEVAQQLILHSPSYLTPEQHEQIDLANAEIDSLNQELRRARAELATLEQDLLEAQDPAEIRELREQRNAVASLINEKSRIIAEFSAMITDLRERSNSLEIVDHARIPTEPVGISAVYKVALGAFMGIFVVAVGVLLHEYLNDTLQSPAEVTQLVTWPTLGIISRFGSARDSYSKRLITFREPHASAADAYRTLRTNLCLSADGIRGQEAYIVTSPGPAEGKTVTVANLAVAMAMAGLRVVLIDADLRRPKLHQVFNLKNDAGLANLLMLQPDGPISGQSRQMTLSSSLEAIIQDTEIPGLRVITSGHATVNPTELLASDAMKYWLACLRSASDVDIILFDMPPILTVADSVELAATGQVPVVLVIQAGRTRRGAVLRAKEQLDVLGVKVAGVVLNGVRWRDLEYTYGYSRYEYVRSPTDSNDV